MREVLAGSREQVFPSSQRHRGIERQAERQVSSSSPSEAGRVSPREARVRASSPPPPPLLLPPPPLLLPSFRRERQLSFPLSRGFSSSLVPFLPFLSLFRQVRLPPSSPS